MVDVVYLSPHLDDVALSCSARIRSERGAGDRVRVLSFFTRGDAGYAERKAEDARALKLLDVEGEHAELPDAPFRSPRYDRLSRLCLTRDAALEDAAFPDVERALEVVLQREQPDRVVAPLGVGGHVDHRLVHLAARRRVPAAKLELYEDRPYALVAGAVHWRLRELGASIEQLPRSEYLRAFLNAAYVKTFLRPRDFVALAHHMRGPDAADPIRADSSVERHGLAARAFAIEVARVYGTQWAPLFGDAGEHDRALREAAESLGAPNGHAERYWRIAT
ncbi:MAG: PIG-L family deacetylase [Deltaproteobacteria bacterium]|nr:PIG-L family deacetylase [Deltaproteobacteria bacterium]